MHLVAVCFASSTLLTVRLGRCALSLPWIFWPVSVLLLLLFLVGHYETSFQRFPERSDNYSTGECSSGGCMGYEVKTVQVMPLDMN